LRRFVAEQPADRQAQDVEPTTAKTPFSEDFSGAAGC
jgi:hypothetical protein